VTEYHVEVSAENVDRDSQIVHGETHAERRVNMGGRSHDLYGKEGSRHGRTTGKLCGRCPRTKDLVWRILGGGATQ
jgi:hypothetical protein